MKTLHLKLFGSPSLTVMSTTLRLGTRKAMALLAYLAIHRNAVQRNELDALLWPEQDDKRARRSLRDEISRVNRTLEYTLVQSFGQEVQIAKGLKVDVWYFEEALSRGDLENASQIYEGGLLAGFHLRRAQPFEVWLSQVRESYETQYLNTLDKLSQRAQKAGNLYSALKYMRMAIAANSFAEDYYAKAMQLALSLGDCATALKIYQDLESELKKELNISPSTKLTTLANKIRTTRRTEPQKIIANENQISTPQKIVTQQAKFINNQPITNDYQTTLGNNLELSRGTPFLGRKTELKEICKLLTQEDCQLLTLVGLGGSGKTTLAKQAALELHNVFPDGVYFIPMLVLNTMGDFYKELASCLNLNVQSDNIQKELLTYLKNKQILLILDHIDNFLNLAKEFKGLLLAPKLRLLVTSRHHLGLEEEWLFGITGLAVPENENFVPAKDFNAVDLFLQFAKRVKPNFKLNSDNFKDIIQICKLTGGLPLGLKLAARKVRSLSCKEIADELSCHGDILNTSFRDMPTRQRSLRDIFQGALANLNPEEKAIFRKLAVFNSPFSRQQALEAAGANILHLATFVENSLLIRATSGEYQLLGFLRQYLLEEVSLNVSPIHQKGINSLEKTQVSQILN